MNIYSALIRVWLRMVPNPAPAPLPDPNPASSGSAVRVNFVRAGRKQLTQKTHRPSSSSMRSGGAALCWDGATWRCCPPTCCTRVPWGQRTAPVLKQKPREAEERRMLHALSWGGCSQRGLEGEVQNSSVPSRSHDSASTSVNQSSFPFQIWERPRAAVCCL